MKKREARVLRNESSADGKRIWNDVDRAASRAPDWVVEKMKRLTDVSEEAPAARPARSSTKSSK
jgi:hypothetical protein